MLSHQLHVQYINSLRLDYYVHRVKIEPYYLVDEKLISEDAICDQKPCLYQSTKHKCGSKKKGYWGKFFKDMENFISIDSLLKNFEYVTYFSDWNFRNKNFVTT